MVYRHNFVQMRGNETVARIELVGDTGYLSACFEFEQAVTALDGGVCANSFAVLAVK